ncbi:carbohydrate binding domain-containing protein [Flavobacterium sp.]|uniref:carbohydrate binding domain-containing protein n=1 Tax=Flavobacterium sp. TaxID=239 RepID=UPI002B4AC75D|nr:carbohydrate binding domain-containing protein [Flavobacterium sp.]HLP65464.1 carbohydrate binding domain-containing protein [Flavobacterium sp.]
MKKITFFLSILFCSVSFSQNIVSNGDFSGGLSSWTTYLADFAGVSATINATNNEANVVSIVGAGGATWHVQLNQVLTSTQIAALTAGQTYKITFDARGASARQLKLYFGEDGGGFVAIHQQDFNLTSTMTNYEATFVVGQTFGAMKLGFEGGLSNVDLFIDNVTLELVPTTPPQLDLLLGFETSETGGVNGGPFGNGPAPVLEAGTGSNTSQVLKIVGNPTGEPWQGINLNLTDLVDLTDTKTMTMDVFSAEPITFLVKVTGGVGGPNVVAASASHPGGSTWETVSFTFNTALDGQAAPANGTYSGFVIHTYWAPGAVGFFNPTIPTPERTFYVDNIRGPLGTPPVIPEPATAAPTPPARPVDDVKSIFSNAYTPITAMGYTGEDNTFNNSWCPGNTTLVSIAGNDTNLVTGLGCEGVTFLNGRFDATAFTHFHLDIWTATATQDKSFNFKFSNWNGTGGEVNAIEYSANNSNILPSTNPGTWISIDLPLSSFLPINGAGRNDLVQFVITSDLGTVYYDNLYLHKNTISLGNSSFEASNIKMYPNPASTLLTIDAEEAIEKVSVFNLLGQEVISVSPSNELVTLDVASLQTGIYVVKTNINGVISSTKFIKE